MAYVCLYLLLKETVNPLSSFVGLDAARFVLNTGVCLKLGESLSPNRRCALKYNTAVDILTRVIISKYFALRLYYIVGWSSFPEE